MLSSQVKPKELRPLRDNDKDYEAIEKKIHLLWKREIYLPLMREIGAPLKLLNAKESLLTAIKDGRIRFYRGTFSGRFNASISRELKALGAQWERTTGTFKLPQSSLTVDVRNAISVSESYFRSKIQAIDNKLATILPGKIADKLKISQMLDSTLFKTEKEFNGSLQNLTVPPQLTDERRKRLADEWQNNLKLYITDWTKEEIAKLRKDVQASVFAGNRHETIVKIVKSSHDASINKAKFLARQETRLLLTKFKQTRYEEAGVGKYKWGISNNPIQPKGSEPKKGQVRHDHGILEGKIFSWNNPPITDSRTGARNNPGQDYNCRCFAIPIVEFKKI